MENDLIVQFRTPQEAWYMGKTRRCARQIRRDLGNRVTHSSSNSSHTFTGCCVRESPNSSFISAGRLCADVGKAGPLNLEGSKPISASIPTIVSRALDFFNANAFGLGASLGERAWWEVPAPPTNLEPCAAGVADLSPFMLLLDLRGSILPGVVRLYVLAGVDKVLLFEALSRAAAGAVRFPRLCTSL